MKSKFERVTSGAVILAITLSVCGTCGALLVAVWRWALR